MNADEKMAALAANQHGLMAARQLYRCGLSDRQVEHRLTLGRLVAVRRGVYRVGGAPPSPHEALAAAVLAAGTGAVASHASAAVLWGLPGVLARQPEVTVAGGRRSRLAGATVHAAARLPATERTTHRRIPLTTPARTIVDLATSGRLAPYAVEKMLDYARRQRLASDDEVAACALGRRRTETLAALLDDPVDACDGPLAKSVLEHLLAAGIRPPLLEHQVVVDGRVYLLDMLWLPEMVVVEVLGYEVHGTRGAFHHDAERTAALTAAGYLVLPATARTYRRLPPRVAGALAARTMAAS